MQPLTDATAKTLLPLGGRSLLDRALDRLAEAGIARVVVNTHWHAGLVEAHLGSRRDGPRVVLSAEESLLETGGTVARALAEGLLPADAPFLVVNGDSVWFDGPAPAIRRLLDGFRPDTMDGLLMLVRATAMQADTARGDFMLGQLGALGRPAAHEVAPFVFGGLQVLSPRLFDHPPTPPFGLDVIWDRALARGRLAGLVHDGDWFHMSTPRDLDEAERTLDDRITGDHA